MSLQILNFTPTVGTYQEEIPFESPGSVKFQNVVQEIGKKLGLALEDIAICKAGGAAMVSSDYILTVDEIIRKYGAKFQIINRGVVGKN